jgi:hypothetical protein
MKNIYIKLPTYLLLVLAFGAAGCKKFLTEDPKSIIIEDNYYKTPVDALNATNATYFFYNGGGSNGSSQTAYQSLLNVGMDLATDDLDPGPGATNPDVRSLSVHNHSSTNRTFYENWQQHYRGIRFSNLAIQKIPGIDFGANTALRDRYIGEAKFNRAWIYFNLVRLWGDVPLVLVPGNYTDVPDYYIAKSTKEEVYAQIEQELKEAAEVLPNKYGPGDAGRATRGAAISLLAKVYLTKASFPLKISSHYQDAVATAELALRTKDGGSGEAFGYDLRTDYSHVFLPDYKNNEEHIFSAQRLSNFQSQGNNGISGGAYADQVHFYTQVIDPTNPDPDKQADKQFNIYKLYKPYDKRRNASFITKIKGNTTETSNTWYGTALSNPFFPNGVGDSVPYLNKYYDGKVLSTPAESAANTPLLRYSELLLIHAEAENEANGPTGKAYKSYNRVRNRAGLPDLSAGLTQDQFRDSLYLDRRLELVYEYQRWFDLIRQRDAANQPTFVKNLVSVGKVNAVDRNRLFPIPQIELDNNPKLTQNPGW